MDDLVLLSKAQMRRIEPHFTLSHGIPQVDDRRIVSGIIFVIKNGLRWCDAPSVYRTRRSTIASSAGAGLASLTASSRRSLPKAVDRIT